MRATVNRKIYDTETASFLAKTGWGNSTDFLSWSETLYQTKKGAHFLHCQGGPHSRHYCSTGPNSSGWGSRIMACTAEEALNWCEKHGMQDVIESHFGDLVEEA
jgi:hypothetical protein